MIISKIEIKNFRSIEHISLDIEEISNRKCSIFLGINESGKSNILKAISLLDKFQLDKVNYSSDCNKRAEAQGKSIKVIYHLKIGNYSYYKKKFIEKYPKEIIDNIDITEIYKKISINSKNNKRDSIYVSIKENKIFSEYVVQELTIKKISDVYSGTEKITEDNITQLLGKEYSILDEVELGEMLEEDFFDIFDLNVPKVIFWEYDDKYLINNEVNLNQFKSDQTSSIPLRNIFHVAGITDISKRIDLILNSREKRKQLEDELSKKITEYINMVWKEHKINIKVDIENMLWSIMVEDQDDSEPKYSMEQRSDGFKQFISILLNLSAEHSSDKLKNKIILLDEPEVHLHPSGVRYLRDELLNIAQNNTVLVATHSVYMVDKKNLNRHYKVEKEKSLTNIFQIPANNPYMEEVIYESLGTSIYEHIEPNMLIFEGKTDKDLFDAFTKKYNADFKPQNVGTISADGVKKIPTYTKFFNGKLVSGYVLVDSDNVGRGVKKTVLREKNFTKKNTYEINDVLDTKIEATLEDLLPLEIISKCINDEYDISIEIDSTRPVIKQLEDKNRGLQRKIDVDNIKGKIVQFVLSDIAKLTKEKCKEKYPKYHKFVEELHKKLKQ